MKNDCSIYLLTAVIGIVNDEFIQPACVYNIIEMQPFPKASPAQKDVLANLSKAMVDRLARSALHANCKGNLNIMIILLPGFYKTIS